MPLGHRDHVLRDDTGFTIVELVFAAVIFFVAFTALMILMVATQDAALRAKEKADVVNAASSYIERARQVTFDQVGTAGGDPSGTLTESTMTVGATTIAIVPTVTWIDDPAIAGTHNYKLLRVTATASQGPSDPRPFQYVSETIIKVADYYVKPNPPTVLFGSSSPADGSVVWGPSVTMSIEASANGAGTLLSAMNLYYGSLPMLDSFGQPAQWSSSAAVDSHTINWDTTGVDANGVALVPDGIYTLKAEAWDSNGQQGAQTRTVIVDNSPPGSPATITATAAGPSTMNVAWSTVYKGNIPTDHYGLTVKQQSLLAILPDTLLWSSLGTTTYNQSSAAYAVQPFSRYLFSVIAYGPPPNNRTTGVSTQTVGVSGPHISGSYTNSKSGSTYTLTTSINAAGPTFPVLGIPLIGNVKWTIHRSPYANMSSPDKTWTVAGPSILAWTEPYSDRVSAKGGSPSRYYQVTATVIPAGYLGGDQITVPSQIVGPLGGTGSGSF